MEKDKDKDEGKIICNKIKYSPNIRPKLHINTHIFEVVEISEKEIWLTNNNKTNLDKKIRGKLSLLCGESLDIEGIIIWKKDNDFGLTFENLISSDKLLKEFHHLIKL